jgi:hypothetical protein
MKYSIPSLVLFAVTGVSLFFGITIRRVPDVPPITTSSRWCPRRGSAARTYTVAHKSVDRLCPGDVRLPATTAFGTG